MITPENIPITTYTSLSRIDKEIYVSKCATSFTIKEENVFVAGYGFSYNRDLAEKKAYYEFIEHFFALDYINKSTRFECSLFLDGSIKKIFNNKDVLIGYNGLSASGLSCHTTYENAVTHSCMELIERHLCCLLWYKQVVKLIKYKEEILEFDEIFTLTHYILNTNPKIPFVITRISNDRDIFILSSAFKNDILASMTHSRMEAIMLLENIKFDCFSRATNKNIIQKIKSLKSSTSNELKKHFEGMIEICDADFAIEEFNLIKSLRNNFIDIGNLWTCLIYYSENIFLVRALAENALTLENERKLSNKYIDPFC